MIPGAGDCRGNNPPVLGEKPEILSAPGNLVRGLCLILTGLERSCRGFCRGCDPGVLGKKCKTGRAGGAAGRSCASHGNRPKDNLPTGCLLSVANLQHLLPPRDASES